MSKLKLRDIAKSQTGPFGSQLHEEDYVSFGTPIVTVEHLGETSFTYQNLPFVSDKDRDRLKKYLLFEGDIVFSRVGSVDRNTYVSRKENGWLFSGRCIRVRVDKEKADSKFLSFYFRQKYFKEMMLNISVGATMPSLNTTLMDNIPLNIPEITTQQKIAAVLSALDDKIELNNQINAELEAMAKTLYDYWFVQFDFPNNDGKPYKSSGGKMVYNEVLKREIPEGWEVIDFGVAFQISRGTLVTKETSTQGSFKVVAAGLNYSYLHGEYNREKYTITVSGSGANAGFVNFWTERIFASDCTTVRGTTDGDTFLGLQYLKLYQNHIYSQAKGSAQPHVYPSDIQGLKYLRSNSDLETKAGDFLQSVYEKIGNNIQQNQELAQLRDWLLPMLMNGQVTAGEVEEKMGMVAEEKMAYSNNLNK